ncbi:transposase [Rhodopirellula europaea 6C]|uniref:Transposase n=1 Tax=Rhodopirellula europaea 6C TaxID=1263867 RepID=M2AMF9_9BACT|nr:transposase [Rhodopirellula europaea 6C]
MITNNLSAHSSESCVRYLVASCGVEKDLFKKCGQGILKSVASRVAFLTDSSPELSFCLRRDIALG